MGFENGRLVRVALRATKGDAQEVTTLHYDLQDTVIGDNDPQSLADLFRDDVLPLWGARFFGDWTIQPVTVTEEIDPRSPLDPRSQWTSGSPFSGTQVNDTDILPPGSTCVVKLLTGHVGRRFRGRIFVPGVYKETTQAGGLWSTALKDSIDVLVDAIPREPDLAGPGVTASAHWCVYSRTQRAANLDPYASAVVSATVNPMVHFRRRRSLYA